MAQLLFAAVPAASSVTAAGPFLPPLAAGPTPPPATAPACAPTTLPTPAPPRDQRRAPILDALLADRTAGTVPFTTPGHRHGAAFDPALRALLGDEFGAADVWLNTADLAAALAEAEALAAEAWGADRAFFLSNGSSAGNHAALLATLAPGDEVVVGRDLHQSLLTGLVMSGARPVYVAPTLHPELGIGLGVDPADLAAALDAHPAARLAVVTSPTYWGVAGDVAGLAAAAHRRGAALYVDAAWGPHLGFHPALPPSPLAASPLAAGADAATTSPHKLLSGLSQAAVLLVRGDRIDAGRLAAVAAMVRTTSPLLPILASLDACRRQLALAGGERLERAVALAEGARRRLRALPGIEPIDAARLGLPPERVDPTRLVLDVAGLGLSGVAVERLLRERFAVAPEMSDLLGIVCLVTWGDTAASVDRLTAALTTIAGEAGPASRFRPSGTALRSAAGAIAPGEQALSPRDAFFARSRAVPLADAAGEVAAEAVVPYPPGIPVLTPGEVATPDKLAYLRAALAEGIHVRGPADPTLATLRVVAG
jgi:lysine decarboxylase